MPAVADAYDLERAYERVGNRFDPNAPSASIAAAWRKQIRLAADFKLRQFDIDAYEALKFYNSDHSFLWDAKDPRSFMSANRLHGFNAPDFSYTWNVAALVVQLFGPTMYAKNPFRQVNPWQPVDIPTSLFVDPDLQAALSQAQSQLFPPQPPGMPAPQGMPGQSPPQPAPNPMVQQMVMALEQQLQGQQAQYSNFVAAQNKRFGRARTESALLQKLLNYTPNALDLKTECRRCVDEALITGLSWMWTELYTFPGSRYVLPGSFQVSSADVVLDPDANCMKDCQYMARRSVLPTWVAERKFKKRRGSIKGNLDSLAKQSQWGVEDWAYSVSRRSEGNGKDLIVIWEIWSKMGMGGRIKNVRDDVADLLEQCGDNVYLAVADGYRGLLNVPDDVMRTEDPEEIWPHVQWPISYWADNAWPGTPLYFHEVPNQIYPMGHLKPAIGKIRFVDFVMSFLAKKVRTVCDDVLGIVKSAVDDWKKAMSSSAMPGYKVLEIEQYLGVKSIQELISYIQAPPFHGDIYKVVAAEVQDVKELLGITELAFGSSERGMRSAKEAEVKQQNFSVRPEDMQNKTEDCMTLVARKEAIAAREHLTADDVAPVLGPEAALLWEKFMEGRELDAIMREFDYRIEANSIRKPNRDRDTAIITQLLQWLLPVLENSIKLNPANIEALNSFLKKAFDTLDLSMADVPNLQGPQQGADPKLQEIQARVALLQQQLQANVAKNQSDAAARQQEAAVRQATANIEQQRAQVELQNTQQQMLHDQQHHESEIGRDLQVHAAELAMQREKHSQDLQLAEQQAAFDRRQAAKQRTVKP